MRSWRYVIPLFAGGTAASCDPRHACARLDGRCPARVRAVAIAVVAAVLGMGMLSTIARMYRDRQETRRKEIELHGMELLAAAFARAIDASHTMAQQLPPAKQMAEAARVRDSARQITVDLVPVIEKLAPVPRPALSPDRLDAELEPEPAQLADPVHAN